MNTIKAGRIWLAIFALLGLAAIYLFQKFDLMMVWDSKNDFPSMHFIVNRSMRIILNDLCMLLLIWAIFADKKVLKIAFIVQLIDIFILFPLYLAVKLPMEGPGEISAPLLSQFHRLIVNPTLMILVIPAVYYYRLIQRGQNGPGKTESLDEI